MLKHRFIAFATACGMLLSCLMPAWAVTVISVDTVWTPTSIATPGVTYNSGSQTFTLTNSLVINSGSSLRILQGNGVDGANFTLNLPQGGFFNLQGSNFFNSAGVLDLSAQSGNGNAGNFLVNMLGNSATIQMDGIIRANGLGSGRGGVIQLNASSFSSLNGTIQALGGNNGGAGGVINIRSTSTQPLTMGGTLQTSGLSNASQNLITIEADAINQNGVIQANGTGNNDGGSIQLLANNGKLTIANNATLSATGSGAGAGGTVDLRASQGSSNLSVASSSCFLFVCFSNNSAADIQLNNSAPINVAGGNNANTGIIRIGRTKNGSINQDFTAINNNQFAGVGTVQMGNDGGYTKGITISNYDAATEFGASNPLLSLVATTSNISGVSGNNFDRVSATTTTGKINLTDTTGGMNVSSLSAGDNVALITQNNGALSLQNASITGSTSIVSDGDANLSGVIQNGSLSIISNNGNANVGDNSGMVIVNGASNVNTKGSATFKNYTQTGSLNVVTQNSNVSLGENGAAVNINGPVAFSAGSADVTGYGQFGGTLTGTAGRIGIEASNGNLTSGGLVATSSNGWWGASDESLILVTRNGRILGSGFTTSGAADMRLQAGMPGYLGSGNSINVSNVSAGQNLRLFASGDSANNGTGNAIAVGDNSSVAGHITATGLNNAYQFAGTNGKVDLSLASGNLKTALVWTQGKDITLTANNGNILQDASVYNFASLRGNTLTTEPALGGTGSIFLNALGGANRYINTGGFGYNLTAKASGDSAGNGTGSSVQLFGHSYNNVSVTNASNNNVTGSVALGNSLGDLDNLDDVNTVMDIDGSTLVKANGNVSLFGSATGPVTILGKSILAQVDKGDLNIASIISSANAGTGISLTALQGRLTGGNLSTTGGAHIYLQAGSQTPRDQMSYIDLSNVTTNGNLNVVVAGSTTGNGSGSSVKITGQVGGSTQISSPSGGAPLGSVTVP